MKIIETDTNDQGQTVYLLQKGNPTGTLVVATEFRPNRFSYRYLLTGKVLTARDTVAAFRAVNERITIERQ